MKYEEGVFPPEPSDVPVEIRDLTKWEQDLVRKVEEDQQKAAININRYGLSYMDIPPFNCQSPIMIQMMQKLFNIPSSFVLLQNFTMYDKDGRSYVPSQGGTPGL
tara:strand:- start:274 stop:588 length:315 start_codon:yes stop_codon:yes gene_type:complete